MVSGKKKAWSPMYKEIKMGFSVVIHDGVGNMPKVGTVAYKNGTIIRVKYPNGREEDFDRYLKSKSSPSRKITGITGQDPANVDQGVSEIVDQAINGAFEAARDAINESDRTLSDEHRWQLMKLWLAEGYKRGRGPGSCDDIKIPVSNVLLILQGVGVSVGRVEELMVKEVNAAKGRGEDETEDEEDRC
jgi:hypothetical protein